MREAVKTAVLFYSYVQIKCDLYEIRDPTIQYYLVATDNILNNLQANQRAFFKKVILIKEMTFAHTKDIVEKLIEDKNADSVYLLTSDESSIAVVSQLRENFNLPGANLQQTLPFINKLIMKEKLTEASISMPKFLSFDAKQYQQNPEAYLQHIDNILDYPMLAKPTDRCGSSSVFEINAFSGLQFWARNIYHKEVNYEIDEYIEGTLYHCDSLIKNNQIIYQNVSEYFFPCAFFGKGYPLGSIILPKNHQMWNPIAEFNKQVIACLKPSNGATHLEVFVKNNGDIIFLEIANRPPGADVIQSIANYSGINLELEHYKLQLQIDTALKPVKNGVHYIWLYIPKINGVLKTRQVPKISSRYDIQWLVTCGETMHAVEEGSAEIAYRAQNIAATMIIYNNDYATLHEDFQRLKQQYAQFLIVE